MRLSSTVLTLLTVMGMAAPALAWEIAGGKGGGFSATLTATQPVKGLGGKPAKPALSVSCGPGGLYATVSWPDPVAVKPDQHFVAVAWALDGSTHSASMLATPGSVGLAGSEAKEWVREFAGAKQLMVRVPDAHGGQSASFDLTGAGAVQAGIATSACG
jgi:hypothetical protein